MSTSTTFPSRMASHRLILSIEQFSRSTLALYAELDETERLREAFLKDPAGVIRERIFPGVERSNAGSDSQVNRFLFALLGSSRFRRWMAEYQDNILRQLRTARAQSNPKEGMRLAVKLLDRRKWLQDLTAGLKTYGQEKIYRAFLPPGVALEDCPVPPELSRKPVIISHAMLAAQVSAWLDHVFGAPPNASEARDRPAQVSCLTDDQLFALYDFFYRSPRQEIDARAGNAALQDHDAAPLPPVVRPSRIFLRQFAIIITQQLMVCVEGLRMSREMDRQHVRGQEAAEYQEVAGDPDLGTPRQS